jgi:nitroimidazol reductase NimA-like FMN-containing flavoprotein (pyridoxamine 5'-phosphate oxidase superfamily)
MGAQHDCFITIKGHPSIIGVQGRFVRPADGPSGYGLLRRLVERVRDTAPMRETGPMSRNRTTPARMPERLSTDPADLQRLLREQTVGHFAFVDDDRPAVLPIAFAPVFRSEHGTPHPDALLLHGSTGSWWLRRLATGIPVTAAVTALDALVYARSAFESSMRYRSAVLFGSCTPLDGDDKVVALDLVTDGLLPGRTKELREHSRRELAATLVLRMRVEEWTLKTSTEWPEDAADDIAGPAWAGVLPLVTSYGEPLPAPDLHAGIPLAPSVERLRGRRRGAPEAGPPPSAGA